MEGSAQVPCASLTGQTQVRPSVSFPPDIWRNRFDSNILPSNQKELEWYDREVELLKNEVEDLLINKFYHSVERIKFVDLLCRLGLSYHFQADIGKHLHQIFTSEPDLLDKKDYDLYTVAVVFRVFRQHGHKMSSDVFNKFKDGEKVKFKEQLANDLEGLLSLFEASHLSTHGEDILEEALAFTTTRLKLAKSRPDFANEISSSLTIPLHKAPPRLKAREFISFFEKRHQDYDEPPNVLLLKFAKLDFNRVQLLHQQEIASIYKWSKDLDLQSKLPFARDRIMEYFFWAESTYYEPHYAYARAEYIKQCNLITFLDDVYDTYGSFDELPILTGAIERWDKSMIEKLPKDYMKHLYEVYLDIFEEYEKQAALNGTSMVVSLMRDYLLETARVYNLEVEWVKSNYIPSFEESLKMGMVTMGYKLLYALTFIGMGQLRVQAFQWLHCEPELAKAVSVIARLANELVSYKRDEESGNVNYPFACYKREYKSSDEETVAEFQRRISSAWKTANEQLMRDCDSVPLEILIRVINYGRLIEVCYKDGDGITDGKKVESYIKTMYIDPIPL